jgi:predicted nucleic acid-binding protein
VARVDALQFSVLEFDEEDARQAGQIRAHLASKGTPIGPYDVLIAGQAKARELILVTKHDRVPASTGPEGRRLERSQFAAPTQVEAVR